MTLALIASEHLETEIAASDGLKSLSAEFLREATGLQRVIPERLPVSLNLTFGDQASVQATSGASETQWSAILHKLRPFVLNDERLFVPKYLNRFKSENQNPVAVGVADTLRDNFLARYDAMIIKSGDHPVNYEIVWQEYANAYEYHRDSEKRLRLERMFGPDPEVPKFLFWMTCSMKVRAVLSMMGFAALLLGENSTFTVNLRDPPPA